VSLIFRAAQKQARAGVITICDFDTMSSIRSFNFLFGRFRCGSRGLFSPSNASPVRRKPPISSRHERHPKPFILGSSQAPENDSTKLLR
jgi:hypothetical protein